MSLHQDLQAQSCSPHQATHTVAIIDRAAPLSRIAATPLRRLALELALVLIAKLVALMLIWWVLFAPHPRPDASADAIARRMAPTTHTATEVHP